MLHYLGATEVLLSPEPRMFIIETNKTTWEHQVTLDPEYDIVEDPDLDSDDELTLNQKLKSMEHFLRLSSGPMVAEINENEKHARSRRANIR